MRSGVSESERERRDDLTVAAGDFETEPALAVGVA